MKTFKPLFSCLLLLCVVTFACKKKNNATPSNNNDILVPSAKDLKIKTVDITGIGYGSSSHYDLVYNADGNLDTLFVTANFSTGAQKYVYIHNGFYIIYLISMHPGYLPGDTTIVNTNDSGYITQVSSRYNTTAYTYTGNNVNTQTNDNQVIYNCFWNDKSDIDSIVLHNTGMGTEYYTHSNMPSQPGDIVQIRDFLNYGRSIIRPLHLTKQKTADVYHSPNRPLNVYDYIYKYDDKGRITQMDIKEDSAFYMTYKYQY